MKRISSFILLYFVSLVLYGQRTGGVAIADSLVSADESSMLQIISTKKGLLLPVVSPSERDKIAPQVLGLTVFVKDSNSGYFQYWNGKKWISLEVISQSRSSMIAPLGGVIMYHGRFDNFDTSGKGLPGTEMEGWQLCNGENGSPDLSGRFIVEGGRETDLTNKDKVYRKIGEKNTISNQFSIRKENLPAHSHPVDKSSVIMFKHTHDLTSENKYELNSQKDSSYDSHLHQFLTRHDGARTKGELSRKNIRNESKIDELYLHQKIDLTSYHVGNKTAAVSFEVDNSTFLPYPEKEEKISFDNRPKFYVLAFIIRIDENINEGGYKGSTINY